MDISKILTKNADWSVIVYDDLPISYKVLKEKVSQWCDKFKALNIMHGQSIAVIGQCSPETITLLLALIQNTNIIMPLAHSKNPFSQYSEQFSIAKTNGYFVIDEKQNWRYECLTQTGLSHPMLDQLRQVGKAGVVFFSSGTTGGQKAALFDIEKLFLKYLRKSGKPYRTLTFLSLDHIGGVNTLFSILTSGGTIITTVDQTVQSVCSAIARHKVQLLPTTPTFLNMLLMSQAQTHYDLNSLKMITYGTEPMPENLLKSVHKVLPDVKLKQTYGATEFGILATRSLSSDSTWIKIGGPNTDVRIVDGTLWVRTDLTMLGYLNSPSPFDEQGWYNTKDKVETHDGYFRILGRDTDVINVGGEKVHPLEVENHLMQLPNVNNVLVYGRDNQITGQVVAAQFVMEKTEELQQLRKRVWAFCSSAMESYKIPRYIEIAEHSLVSDRFKKMRKPELL